MMSFTAKTVNGSLRYRATKALRSILPNPASKTQIDANKPSIHAILRQNPFFLSLPAISLPTQLDLAAINYLREHSLSTPKSIEARAKLLTDYLWSRSLPTETKLFERKLRSEGAFEQVDSTDEGLTDALQYHHVDKLVGASPRNVRVMKEAAIEEWKSFTYSGNNCELYLTARLVPNFASVCRILYEIRKRCCKFLPRNLFDFGSGLGSVTWAANTVWPVGCVKEHFMFEPSADMTKMSEFLFRKNFVTKSPETFFSGIYHRRFLPAAKQKYDLVVSAHTLLELPGEVARSRVLATLWDRTSDFLVLVEQGTKAGFNAILEARDWLIQKGGDEVYVFAPCPHTKECAKKGTVCNIFTRYYPFGLTKEKNEPQTELISYLIVCRGDWRRFQIPVVEPDPMFLPRLVSFKPAKRGNLAHDICLPSGMVERTMFSKRHTDKSLLMFLNHAKTGDIVPCEPFSSDEDTVAEDEADISQS